MEELTRTIVVGLVGGSGLGKSTTAAMVFGRLKQMGCSVELVREFVKEWAIVGKKVGPFGQSIIYGQQLERESMLYGRVDFIVTDSPLVLCPIYQQHYDGHDSIKHAVFNDLNTASKLGVFHQNFLLRRQKKFDPRGRYETEEVAKLIDRKVESFLIYNNIPYEDVNVPQDSAVEFIVSKALKIKESLGESNV